MRKPSATKSGLKRLTQELHTEHWDKKTAAAVPAGTGGGEGSGSGAAVQWGKNTEHSVAATRRPHADADADADDEDDEEEAWLKKFGGELPADFDLTAGYDNNGRSSVRA